MNRPLLRLIDLQTEITTREGTMRVVDNVNLEVRPGEAVALVGESGCGKSMTALSILRLLPQPAARIVGGEVIFEDTDLLALSERELVSIRGRDIGMIFQDPMTFLNPVLTVGRQIAEPLRYHTDLSAGARKRKAIELLERMRIPDPEQVAQSYPHQLSGGMRQRVLIAGALSCAPRLLIADEPTTALDVTVQARILDLLKESLDELGTSLLLITHNMGVVAGMCDRAYVMYAGNIVETAGVEALFAEPKHPYTKGLLASALRHDQAHSGFSILRGSVPNLIDPPAGCRFQPRCDRAMSRCATPPPWTRLAPDAGAACWLHAE